MFKIDFLNALKLNTHPVLRKPLFLAWIKALIVPLITLKGKFDLYRAEKDRQMKYNSQTIILEALLNDYFDNNLRRIYIDNKSFLPKAYVYLRVEGIQEAYLYPRSAAYPLYTFTRAEYNAEIAANPGYEFIVMVPASLVFDQEEMKALINLYRFAGKRYKIQLY